MWNLYPVEGVSLKNCHPIDFIQRTRFCPRCNHHHSVAHLTSKGILPQLLDRSDALDLHFYHTRRPMSALSNIFPSPELLGSKEGRQTPLATVLKPWRRHGVRASVWSALKYVCLKGGRVSSKGVWTRWKTELLRYREQSCRTPRQRESSWCLLSLTIKRCRPDFLLLGAAFP